MAQGPEWTEQALFRWQGWGRPGDTAVLALVGSIQTQVPGPAMLFPCHHCPSLGLSYP